MRFPPDRTVLKLEDLGAELTLSDADLIAEVERRGLATVIFKRLHERERAALASSDRQNVRAVRYPVFGPTVTTIVPSPDSETHAPDGDSRPCGNDSRIRICHECGIRYGDASNPDHFCFT